MKLLIHPPMDDESLASVRAVAPDAEIVSAATESDAAEAIRDSDALYGGITSALLAKAQRLRWVQAPWSGLDHYVFPALIESDVVLTNMQGIYGDHIADQAMGYILMFARGLHVYVRRQLERTWRGGAPIVHLADQTLGIIGLGGIGTEVARRGAACGMRVIAVDFAGKPKPEFVEALWTIERLPDLLRESDFVVSCVPHTPETVKLLGPEQIALMKRTAYLINVSRGIVVDLEALTRALETGNLAGAGLDVFEIEPLPADHPLWGMENVIITPHTGGGGLRSHERRMEILKENVRRFVAGEPLMNVVDKRRWC